MNGDILHPCNIGDLLDKVDVARCVTCADLVVAGGKWVKPGHLCECCGFPVCSDCGKLKETIE